MCICQSQSLNLSLLLSPGNHKLVFFICNSFFFVTEFILFSSVQSLSWVWLLVTSWIAAHQASLSITNSWSPPETHVHQVSDAIQPSHPLSSPSPPAPNLSQHQGLFKWVSSLHQVASFGVAALASVLPMNIQDWFLLGLVCLISLQSRGLSRVFSNTTVWKHQVLWHSAFFVVQLSHPHMTTGKTIALARWTFVGRVMLLLFNMLPLSVIAFLPRSKCLNFMAAVTNCSDFRAQENKVSHCFHCFRIYLPWSDGTWCRDLSFLNTEF